MAAACTSEVGGPRAFVEVWRDAAGRPAMLELHPDMTRFHVAMTAFYDRTGKKLAALGIPRLARDEPEYLRAREPLTRGLTRSETLRCTP
jgi:hypothetical protein